jgi:adenylate cyclase class 2
MYTEIEAKLKVDSLEAVKKRLIECGASQHSETVQADFYFDTEERDLTRSDRCLRLRCEHEGGRERFIITYKGAREAGDYKRRAEVELEVQNRDAAEALLAALGYHRALAFNKRRHLWRLGGCAVALDELPLVGAFVEIEGPSSDEIRHVQTLLSLTDATHVPESYASLIAGRLAQLGIEQAEVFL